MQRNLDQGPGVSGQIKGNKNMDKTLKKSTVLCAGIFVFLGIWMVLTVPCRAAETNNDEKQSQNPCRFI